MAMVFDQREEQRHQRTQMPAGPLRADDFAVLQQAGTLALKWFFGQEYDLEAVTTFAAATRSHWKLPSGASLMDLAAVMRVALGERDVDLSEIPDAVQAEAHTFSLMAVSQRCGWNETQVDQLVAKAEAMSLKRGWRPHAVPSLR